MEPSPAGQLTQKNAHTVSTTETCTSSTCGQSSFSQSNSIEETECFLKNKDEMSDSLRDHMRQLVHLYKKIVIQAEDNRLNYCVALEELEKYKQLTKIILHKGSKQCRGKCNKEMSSINDNQQTNGDSLLPNKISKSIDTSQNQFIVLKKQTSDIKIQLAINTKGACNCANATEDSKKPTTKEVATLSEEPAALNFVDVKDSITVKLKEENEILKQEVETLQLQLKIVKVDKEDCGEGEGDLVEPFKRSVSFVISRSVGGDKSSINDSQLLQSRINELLLENKTLKDNLEKALEALQGKQEMQPIYQSKEKLNDDSNKQMSDLILVNDDRLEEMYIQTKVNSRLINEIFWKLEQIQKDLQSMRVPGRIEQEAVIEKRIVIPLEAAGGFQESKKETEVSLSNGKECCDRDSLDIERNGEQDTYDVATNCVSYCLCRRDQDQKGRYPFKAVESSCRSTELGQQNLDAKSQDETISRIIVAPVENVPINSIIDNEPRTASCNQQFSNSETESTTPSAKSSQRKQPSDDSTYKSNCFGGCNDKADAEARSGYSARYNEYLYDPCSTKGHVYLNKFNSSTSCSQYYLRR